MIELIEQMQASSKAKQFHIALIAALVLPDICSALESANGEAAGSKYRAWVDKWLSPKYGDSTGTSLSGETCYYYRCAVLHQNRSLHSKLEFERVAFLEPNGTHAMHDCVINNVLVIDNRRFAKICPKQFSSGLGPQKSLQNSRPISEVVCKGFQAKLSAFPCQACMSMHKSPNPTLNSVPFGRCAIKSRF